MAERILLLSEPHSARLSSMRASALAVCSYIEAVTGSGATATVNTRLSRTTARLRVGVRPGNRLIMIGSDATSALVTLFRERTRGLQVQGVGIGLVAGA